MDEFDGRCNIDDVLGMLAAKRKICQEGDHRPHALPAAVDEMSRYIREGGFAGANRASQIFFDELQRLTDATERIVGPVEQRNLSPGIRYDCRSGLQSFRFGFLNQKNSAQRLKSSRKMA
jgi:hypothetical protein